MKINEPIGNAIYGPLLIRLPLGLYLIMAGLYMLSSQNAVVNAIQGLRVLPEPFATLYGVLLPYIAIAFGSLILIGLWTTLAALVVSFTLLPWIFGLGLFDHRHFLNRDLILLGASLSLMYSGAGACSVDRFRKSA